ncbi:MAG TPA: ABC transporter C-terminal domain-containing protein, partial [Candidatus Eisenbacteria bacterium]|nr:ABC transporter C-terminal domain-containing protein [Candidatus Eisenbacteria bacterium]
GGRGAARGREPRARELERLEREIRSREARLRELETALADPGLYHDAARSRDAVQEYERLRAEVESLWQRVGELG